MAHNYELRCSYYVSLRQILASPKHLGAKSLESIFKQKGFQFFKFEVQHYIKRDTLIALEAFSGSSD